MGVSFTQKRPNVPNTHTTAEKSHGFFRFHDFFVFIEKNAEKRNEKKRNVLKMAKMNRVQEIKAQILERYGIETDVFCDNDLDIYCQQMEMLQGLKKALQEDGYVVEKTYSGGKKNKYSHPAIADYNRTADSSHKTVNAIRKFLSEYGVNMEEDGDDLMSLLNGEEDAE